MISIKSNDYMQMADSSTGICLDCGAHVDCVEPDAEQYVCEDCGEEMVYGVEQALIMGLIDID